MRRVATCRVLVDNAPGVWLVPSCQFPCWFIAGCGLIEVDGRVIRTFAQRMSFEPIVWTYG